MVAKAALAKNMDYKADKFLRALQLLFFINHLTMVLAVINLIFKQTVVMHTLIRWYNMQAL